MKSWNTQTLYRTGLEIFNKIHQQKRLCGPTHEVHELKRNQDWLLDGISAIQKGHYSPAPLVRYYIKNEMIEKLSIRDRILQHLILQQLKPCFKHMINPHCYHLAGPEGVKRATDIVLDALKNPKYKYVIRTDIKSFYSSIPRHKLVQEVCASFHDVKVQTMLGHIIENPSQSKDGYRNPTRGIALRGPLSQFFSALYLKPLDDAFATMDVTYLRFQDDILILCQSLRQLKRCHQRLLSILDERKLSISKKKTFVGSIERGFHFLGLNYPGTQTPDSTKNQVAQASIPLKEQPLSRVTLHPKSIRKARIQVLCMVEDGLSAFDIMQYIKLWAFWWRRCAGYNWQEWKVVDELFLSMRHPQGVRSTSGLRMLQLQPSVFC